MFPYREHYTTFWENILIICLFEVVAAIFGSHSRNFASNLSANISICFSPLLYLLRLEKLKNVSAICSKNHTTYRKEYQEKVNLVLSVFLREKEKVIYFLTTDDASIINGAAIPVYGRA